MKKSALVIALISLFAGGLFAEGGPTKEEWKNMSKAEPKAYRQAELTKQQEETIAILESQKWVLEADRLQDRYGETYNIQSNINFIGVAEESATVQLGSSHHVGTNGVGGVTVDGRITKYDVKENKKANSGAVVILHVSGTAGHANVMIHVSPNGMASATLSGIDGTRLTYHGDIVALEQSRVYKGTTLF